MILSTKYIDIKSLKLLTHDYSLNIKIYYINYFNLRV